jgi:hypothetical protein
MRPFKYISLQVSDFLVFLAVPAASVILPAAVSRRLVTRMAAWRWLLAGEAAESLHRAAEYTAIGDTREWKRRWRTVVMLEARDLGLMMWGRGRSVFGEIGGAEQIGEARDSVLVGMHWGPSISILGLLKSRGLGPLLVYRPVERSILRHRPFYYYYLAFSVRYIRKTCGERAIAIRGAGDALRRELPRPGTSVVVLDAPPAPGRSTIGGTVLERPVKYNAGFPGILEASGREYRFYAISLQEGETGLKKLDLTPARRPESQEQLMGDYCQFLTEHLRKDSAQWRIWTAAGQFFQPGAGEHEGKPPEG